MDAVLLVTQPKNEQARDIVRLRIRFAYVVEPSFIHNEVQKTFWFPDCEVIIELDMRE